MADLEAGLVLGETEAGVEAQRRRVFRACHQHDLVAIQGPAEAQCVKQDTLSNALLPEARVGDHVFDDTVRPAPSRKVWNDGNGAACNELVAFKCPKVVEIRTAEYFILECTNMFSFRQRIIGGVQVRIDIQ